MKKVKKTHLSMHRNGPDRSLDKQESIWTTLAPGEHMTQPRRVLKGATYLVTRRCVDRQFLLTPRGKVPDLFGYAFAKSIKEHGMLLHGVMTMPNHWHSLITDPDGVIDKCARDTNSLSARSLNAHLSRWEAFWSSQGLSLVRIESPEDLMDKLVYMTMNPVKAGLVERPADWPGFKTLPSAPLRRPRVIKRPKTRFYARSKLPEEVELEVTVPPQLAHLGKEEFVRQYEERVKEEVEALRAERKREGKSVMGVHAVLRQRKDGKPKSREVRRGRDPVIACKNKEQRLKAIGEERVFRRDYRDAWKRQAAGEARVVFPAGTLLMVRLHGALCERAAPIEYLAA
jgi:REP element-mobilizing transposase RayT